MPRLPRILYAVPQLPHVHLEIAEAIQTLAAPEEKARALTADRHGVSKLDPDLVKRYAHEISRELLPLVRSNFRGGRVGKAAVDDPKHPGWPAGTPGGKGGQFRPKDDASNATDRANAAPEGKNNERRRFGPAPEIPKEKPSTEQAINAFLKAAAYWVFDAMLAGEPVGDFILALEAVAWLHQYLPLIRAYLEPPKTWQELQQNALSSKPGNDIHHPVERTSARQDGFPWTLVDAAANRLSISRLRHWLLNGWYSTRNEDFGAVSPRDYLRRKSWQERLRIGRDAMIQFKILKP